MGLWEAGATFAALRVHDYALNCAGMSDDAPKFRIGSVQYFNAVPLTRGIEGEVIFATPAQLAEMLRRDELDAALVSITEVLLNDRYDILDGVAIASLGEVYSVLLAHCVPLESITEVFCDPASLTSVNLLKVLLAERGIKPEFKPLPDYDAAARARCRAAHRRPGD